MSDTQVSSFPNVLFDPMMARRQTAADIANQYAPQRNQLLLDEGRQQLDFAAQKNPLDIMMLRQQLGLDGSPGTAALDDIYRNGQPPAPTAPGSFEQKMGGSESGNDPSKVNKGGYSGQFQFGAARLADLGVYHPAEGEDLSKNEWKGTFSIPGFAVTNHDDFLKNAAAQHAVFGAHVADIDQAIAATPGADKLDPNGLRAVAHLGGVAGMQRFVSTGGLYDPGDDPKAPGGGTHLSQYYAKFAAGGAPALQQAFGSPHGPAGPPGGPGGGVAGRIPGAVTVAGPGAPTGPAPGFGPDGQPLAAGTWDASPVTAAPGAGPGVSAPAPAAPGAAPGAVAPAAAPATGVNSPQVQQAQRYLQQATQIELEAAKYPNNPQVKGRAAAMVQDLRGRAQVLMTAGKVSVDPVTGIQTDQVTGKQDPAATQRQHWVYDAEHGAWVEAGSTAKPEVVPAQRFTTDAQGNTLQGKPGGGVVNVSPADPAAIAAREAAKSQGSAAGAIAGKSVKEIGDLGRDSTKAIENINYGVAQLDRAQKGGINTGYFAPALAKAASVLKAAGLPTQIAGVDPSAIGDIQTARKTLAVVSGAILQQILGRESPITDAKIEAFIHAQPDITNDPDAVRKILGWAQSQFVYDRNMATAAMHAAAPTGMLPMNFSPQYVEKFGFGPIYDPLTNEMKQPDGQGPQQVAPAASSAPSRPVIRYDHAGKRISE